MQWLPFSLLSIDFHLITGEILNVRPEYLINPAWAFYWGEFNKNNHCGWGIFLLDRTRWGVGGVHGGGGERHLNFLIIIIFFSIPPSFSSLPSWGPSIVSSKRTQLLCLMFVFSLTRNGHCTNILPLDEERTFAERRHFHHVQPMHPHLLLQSDFNSVNCYEGSLIAKCGGCQNPTVTHFLLSHFTAILCLTLDTQAWRSPVGLVGYCNKTAFLSYTKC